MFLLHDRKCLLLICNHNFPYSNSCLLPLILLTVYLWRGSGSICSVSSGQAVVDSDKVSLSFVLSRLKRPTSLSLEWSRSNMIQKNLLSCRFEDFRLGDPSTIHCCITYLLDHILYVVLNDLMEKKRTWSKRGSNEKQNVDSSSAQFIEY